MSKAKIVGRINPNDIAERTIKEIDTKLRCQWVDPVTRAKFKQRVKYAVNDIEILNKLYFELENIIKARKARNNA